MSNFQREIQMPGQEERRIGTEQYEGSETTGPRQGQRKQGSIDGTRYLPALLTLLLCVFAVLVGFTTYTAMNGASGNSHALTNAITPLGFGILILLAVMALVGDGSPD